MEEDNHGYLVEFLSNKTVSGMPPHILNFKKGTVFMILPNLNTIKGFCNGTRFILKDLKSYLLRKYQQVPSIVKLFPFCGLTYVAFLTCDFN